jgi:RNA polymerase sigma-70 factor (ECF subfamily)
MPPTDSTATTPAQAVDAEAALVARLKAGDESAFETLVRAQIGRMLVVARRIVGSEAEAEDAVQEAFLSAFRGVGSFDGRSRLSTWLHRILVNAALMRLRKTRARREGSIDDLLPRFEDGDHAEPPERWREAPERMEPEDREAVRRALEGLPEEFRVVLVLKDVEGMESKAIAASLGISDALVRQRLHRGRQAMMTLLAPRMKEGGS